jgi:CBS domain containing-hemolysin-like protein
MLFLAIVAWSAWPTAVIVGCFIVGLLMGLQWLVFSVLWVVKTARKLFRFLVRITMREKEQAELDEKH